jgi:hypothetical protein
LHAKALADLDAVAVDVEHILERVRIGRIEEADHVERIAREPRSDGLPLRDTALSSSI